VQIFQQLSYQRRFHIPYQISALHFKGRFVRIFQMVLARIFYSHTTSAS